MHCHCLAGLSRNRNLQTFRASCALFKLVEGHWRGSTIQLLGCVTTSYTIRVLLWCWLPFLPPFEVIEYRWTPSELIITAWARVFVFVICTSEDVSVSACMCLCTVHRVSTCTVLHYRTLADGWLVLLHSRGTNLGRQLDCLTDFTADNPAGSVSCNNPGRGVILFGSLSAWDTMLLRLPLLHEAKELVIITGSKRGQRVERAK